MARPSDVQAQYEAFPYPERDPADEAKRLITGSPSDPRELDHYLFGGRRDWSTPLRALFAGGGTGDGLIQLAQMLKLAKRPYDITYLDLSKASRKIAEARAKARGLSGITFKTGSLLDAADHGPFDYIDCCGVLHHLPDPLAGFAALRGAIAADGGLGFMVYAPYGRSGVYPLQDAFGTLLEGLSPPARLDKAKQIFDRLPDGHPFKRNTQVVDHKQSDAGFYDLLLHSQDQAFDVARLIQTLDESDWHLSGLCDGVGYELARFAEVPDGMHTHTQMALAEKLNGTIKVHVGYAAAQQTCKPATYAPDLIPHLRGGAPAQIAKAVAMGKPLPVSRAGITEKIMLPKGAAPMIAAANGGRDLGTIARMANLDPIAAKSLWGAVEPKLAPWGLLLYSNLLKGR